MAYADNDVQRFVAAQGHGVYERALAEISAGRKRSHWIWYIFPQVRGLGRSANAQKYGIGSREELDAYVANELLMGRLVEITQALLDLGKNDPTKIMGHPDDMKLRSSMTLFELASDDPVFPQVLEQYFTGARDGRTLRIVEGWEQ